MFCDSNMHGRGINSGVLSKTSDFLEENLVEHLTFNQVVLGSSPSRPTRTLAFARVQSFPGETPIPRKSLK